MDREITEPGFWNDQRNAQRYQRQTVLADPQQLGQQTDSAGRLTPCALEMIVEGRIFEVRKIERRRMLH